MKQYFENQVIWITGASSGIGEALSMAFAQCGAKLILSARREDELKRVASLCTGAKDILILPLDLSEKDLLAEKAQQVISHFGKIDILLNNGGVSQRSLAKDTSIEVDKRLMEVNYLGTVALTKAVLPFMLAKKAGKIVIISSVAGKIGSPLRTGYSAAKFALQGFFEALRAEIWRENVQVLIVCPGFIRTNVSINALTADGSPQQKMDEATNQGLPVERCANLILKAIAQNKEEVIISGFREKYAVWLKRMFPNIFSKMIRKAKVT